LPELAGRCFRVLVGLMFQKFGVKMRYVAPRPKPTITERRCLRETKSESPISQTGGD